MEVEQRIHCKTSNQISGRSVKDVSLRCHRVVRNNSRVEGAFIPLPQAAEDVTHSWCLTAAGPTVEGRRNNST